MTLSVRKASELHSELQNMTDPKAHGLMKCREFQPLKATLDFGLQHGDDNNNNNSLVTTCNLNPNLIVYLTFKMLLSLTSSIK